MELDRRATIVALATLPTLISRRSAATPVAARLKALIVGINEYAHLEHLGRATADARSISTTLRAIGYKVDITTDCDLSELTSTFDQFEAQLDKDDSAFFYYAGHGVQVGDTSFILPRDFQPENAIDLPRQSLSLPELLNRIESKTPKQCIAILDSCRGNEMGRTSVGVPGLASVTAPGGFFVAFSAGAGESAADNLGPEDRSPNSVFARVLLEHIAPDKPIDLILRETRADVVRLAASVNITQCPAIYDQTRGIVRLDGVTDVSSASVFTSSSAVLAGTSTTIVESTTGTYGFYPGVENDAGYVADCIRSLSVEPRIVKNASVEEVTSCLKAASSLMKRRLVYLCGPGSFDGGDSYLELRSDGHMKEPRPAKISLTQVLQALTSHPGQNFVFVDTGLPYMPSGHEVGRDTLIRMAHEDLDNDDFHNQTPFPSCAVLHSASLYQTAADVQPGSINSPFALALDNALALPGLTLQDLFQRVRGEVERQTKGLQTPQLFAGSGMRGQVLITSRGA